VSGTRTPIPLSIFVNNVLSCVRSSNDVTSVYQASFPWRDAFLLPRLWILAALAPPWSGTWGLVDLNFFFALHSDILWSHFSTTASLQLLKLGVSISTVFSCQQAALPVRAEWSRDTTGGRCFSIGNQDEIIKACINNINLADNSIKFHTVLCTWEDVKLNGWVV
jgi:hypothetical protein